MMQARPITPTTTPTAMPTLLLPPPDDLLWSGEADADADADAEAVTTMVSPGLVTTAG